MRRPTSEAERQRYKRIAEELRERSAHAPLPELRLGYLELVKHFERLASFGAAPSGSDD